jgi:hypothetical protein
VRVYNFTSNDSLYLKVFDILRLLIADDFLAILGCDSNILSVLLECCDLCLFFCASIFDKISSIAIAEPSDRLKSIGFICDDIDSSLTSALITVQMAILNQLLKYESLTSGNAFDAIGSKSNCVPNIDGMQSTRQPLDDLNKMRSSIALVSQSVTRIVYSVGAARVLRDLAVNDKELISTLLHGCEVELRLTHNADMTCEKEDDPINRDICKAIHRSHEGALTPSLPFSNSAGRIGSSSSCSSCLAQGQDRGRSEVNKDGNEDFLNQIETRTRSGIGTSGTQIALDPVRQIRNICEVSLRFFSEINFDSLSCFLLFLSRCINFDASLFCDYLSSPETDALKYILRATKRILQLEKCAPQACPSSSSSSSIAHSASLPTIRLKKRKKKKVKEKRRILTVDPQHIPRHKELFAVCRRTAKAISAGSRCEDIKAVSSTEITSRGKVLNLTIAWIKEEKSVFIGETEEECQRDRIFNDESLWGPSDPTEVCQSVHPSEWGEGEKSSDLSHTGTGSIKKRRKRERERERGLSGIDIAHANPTAALNTSSHESSISTRTEPPNGDDTRSCGGRDLDLDPELESACVLYEQTLRFFTDLQRLLMRLGSARRRASMPFDCSLLTARIKRIMVLMSRDSGQVEAKTDKIFCGVRSR